MADIEFVGEYLFPTTDDANDTGTSLIFDKDAASVGTPASGDFVMAVLVTRSQSGTPAGFSVTTTGGQTWTEQHDAQDSMDNALYTCAFDGTWTADPVFDLPGSTAVPRLLWVVILRNVDTADPFDVAFTWATDSDTSYNIADFNTNTDGAWAFGLAGSVDNNTWTVNNSFVAPSGSGNIYRRTSGGTDASIVVCRKVIPTAGAVGAFTMTQATLGADAGFKVFGALKPADSGGNATATPSTVAAVASVPAPSIVANAIATPATVGVVAAVGAPTLRSDQAPSPATVAASAAVPAPTVRGAAVASPATVAAPAAVPAPSPSGTAVTQPATVAVPAAVPAPTVIATAGGDATASPATVAVPAAVGAPTVRASAVTAPATANVIAAVPAPSVAASARPTPSSVQVTSSVPAPTLRSDRSVSPATVNVTGAVPAPAASGTAIATPDTVNVIAAVGAPSIPPEFVVFVSEGHTGAGSGAEGAASSTAGAEGRALAGTGIEGA